MRLVFGGVRFAGFSLSESVELRVCVKKEFSTNSKVQL